MIEQLFTTLTDALKTPSALALGVSFALGVMSIILSPCHLASIPLVVGFISNQKQITLLRAFLISVFFSIGIFLTIAVVGIITALAGRMVGDIGPLADYIVAGVFLLFGLVLLEVLTLPWSGPTSFSTKSKGLLGAFILGIIFGTAIGPCTFAFMAPVLAVVTLKSAYGPACLLLYGLGHCSVIVIAGSSVELVQKYANWNQKSKAVTILRKTCGIAIIICGLYLIYKAR